MQKSCNCKECHKTGHFLPPRLATHLTVGVLAGAGGGAAHAGRGEGLADPPAGRGGGRGHGAATARLPATAVWRGTLGEIFRPLPLLRLQHVVGGRVLQPGLDLLELKFNQITASYP